VKVCNCDLGVGRVGEGHCGNVDVVGVAEK
jgi:hypothetical protein